ncbi:DUF3604 domain-containing protein [Aestuariicella hydrocarbonica]|uniref:DUF3604 domain-containing protein n=1 Tax=Pseudomaricurvus hydrocarbonicus TaxID=1470433 RepID=A0A9E5JXS4_9GAMM|nr:DUF3604 domain-containing protein [Aestuariicella hydrocarbonica]NHO64022.1 DUF3604 domain-containing protein [Aestuariicella hydrocarbonica]
MIANPFFRHTGAVPQFVCRVSLWSVLVLVGCNSGDQQAAVSPTMAQESGAQESGQAEGSVSDVRVNSDKEAYFGNFHVHTSYSFDAYTNGSVTEPDDAFRWAKGEAIPGGGGRGELKIKKPLDWYVVSDHAEYLGVFKKMEDPSSPFSQLPIAKEVTSGDRQRAFAAFSKVLDDMNAGKSDPQLSDPAVTHTIWKEVVTTAEKHNEPGKFTTFPGFEWTSAPGERNLHRVVFFKNSSHIPEVPFSTVDSDKPEDLWRWMEQQRIHGAALLAVAHNGNASDGLMFPEETSYGGSDLNPYYANTRMRNEPIYEVTQIKGTSETHPDLSPTDEFSGFEIWDYTLSANANPPTHRVGSYARDALKRGLLLESRGRGNPYKFGLIGDSDTHNSAASIEEDNYTGKFGLENNPQDRLNGPEGFPEANKKQIREFSSGGVAGIWAEQNTRDSLFDAIQKKETFATSGPRLKVRFFGGYDFNPDMMTADNWVKKAYAQGVPMGGELKAGRSDQTPSFVVFATKEADGANLDRVQVIKGWVKDGKAYEKIYNVALSDGRTVDPAGKVAPVGNTVNASTATYTNAIGDAQLFTVWKDPDFDPAMHAFYYARVLQIPTPRWSTYDAMTLGIPPRGDLPVSIQERAWSSPIWYTP